eukprot:201247-Chlamydomonas_euryale.AAC.4
MRADDIGRMDERMHACTVASVRIGASTLKSCIPGCCCCLGWQSPGHVCAALQCSSHWCTALLRACLCCVAMPLRIVSGLSRGAHGRLQLPLLLELHLRVDAVRDGRACRRGAAERGAARGAAAAAAHAAGGHGPAAGGLHAEGCSGERGAVSCHAHVVCPRGRPCSCHRHCSASAGAGAALKQ